MVFATGCGTITEGRYDLGVIGAQRGVAVVTQRNCLASCPL